MKVPVAPGIPRFRGYRLSEYYVLRVFYFPIATTSTDIPAPARLTDNIPSTASAGTATTPDAAVEDLAAVLAFATLAALVPAVKQVAWILGVSVNPAAL